MTINSDWGEWWAREEFNGPDVEGVSLWFLGVTGWGIRTPETTIFIDPYFSTERDREYIARMPPVPMEPQWVDSCDAVFCTHDHRDHFWPPSFGPLLDHDGGVCGLCGIVQSYERMLDHPQRPVFQVVQYIRALYAERLSIPELADRIGFSQRQLERRLAETFRASPSQYLVRLRVLIASERLRHSDEPISDIAIDCGFYDHSSFIRHFKRTLGVTPLAYRKRNYATHANQ
jgi:AraC-like DNA-binding protein